MSTSRLQEPFLHEFAETFLATRRRIVRRLAEVASADAVARNAVLDDELRGLYHGVLVMFDGGTALADHGLISIADEAGVLFDRHLHEIGFDYWPSDPSA